MTIGRPRNPNPKPHRDGYIYVTVDWEGLGTIRTGQHRVVARETWGSGPQVCFHCDRPLLWGAKGAAALYVDHLNHIRHDNRPDNLVPSCAKCNGINKQSRK